MKQAADELCEAIARLCAGGSPGLITIRGPERVLRRLRERIADLPVVIDFVEDEGAGGGGRGQRHADRQPNFAPGPTCSPRSTPERRR